MVVMKHFALCALAFGLLAGSIAPRPAAAADPTPVSAMTVAGTGSIVRSPDQAVVRLEIRTNDAQASQATSQNNVAYNKLLAALHGLALPDSAIRTVGYNLNYVPRPEQLPQPVPVYQPQYGYTVDRSITVTTNRIDQAGPIVDAAVRSGVTSVGSVSYGLADNRADRRAALAAAVADAQNQAQALADAAHVRLGRILTIAPSGVAPGPRPDPGR